MADPIHAPQTFNMLEQAAQEGGISMPARDFKVIASTVAKAAQYPCR